MQKITYEDLQQAQMAGGCSTTVVYECGGGPSCSSSSPGAEEPYGP